jgi:hypothetical protein
VIKENDMGGACSTNGRDEKYIQKFLSKNLKEKELSEELDLSGRVTKMGLDEGGCEMDSVKSK